MVKVRSGLDGPVYRSLSAPALVAAMLTWASCGGGASPQAPPATVTFDLEEATIADLQRRMERGEDTARSLVEKYTARIERLDRQGPALRSVIELNPDALTIADRLDAERRQTGARGALHGIPILIKDNIATADRMTTTAGSLALEGVRAPQDAFVVSRLRDAGAVILGKTNLSEWANFRSTHSSSGWSARGGQTRTRTRSIGARAVRARVRRSPSPQTWRPPPLEPRPTDRSCVPLTAIPWSASSRRSGS